MPFYHRSKYNLEFLRMLMPFFSRSQLRYLFVTLWNSVDDFIFEFFNF